MTTSTRRTATSRLVLLSSSVFKLLFDVTLIDYFELKDSISMPWTSSFVNYSRNCVRLVVFFRVIVLENVHCDYAKEISNSEGSREDYNERKDNCLLPTDASLSGPFMQSDKQLYPRKVVPPLAYQASSGYMYNSPVAPTVGPALPPGTKHSRSLHGVEFQPSEVCPKNFIIFDQTDDRSRIMFHPVLAHKFNCPGFDIRATYTQDNGGNIDAEDSKRESSSSLKEDMEDIDALLSLEEEEEEKDDDDDDDEELVSTARTRRSNSPDSYSTCGSKPRKPRLSSIQKSSDSGGSCNGERKQQKMKKMVKALRGIVPGGDQMNSAALLDEAVRYLKSLKVEVMKLGIGNFKN
ncbi:hypothetical protein HHK36_003525 [Tetracentron sinense]|uniref:BHLH domain-containing protein n=1 Tax=Tetracentron sinense TaxID=13715 RepID=A0A835DPE1_TETSI|nr:hypothetical protein HHK36_003525 [Tetracentron sinense]